ncbi:hypothetical protein SBA4_6020013 [Candidatus Sulfopaludibacter sp. SbA4]|nr:hypothetical protein SBA4_6020013 [Candidatus Sulfopaludibacter sp. SbA4]
MVLFASSSACSAVVRKNRDGYVAASVGRTPWSARDALVPLPPVFSGFDFLLVSLRSSPRLRASASRALTHQTQKCEIRRR